MKIAFIAQNTSLATPDGELKAARQSAWMLALAQTLAGMGHRVVIYARRDAPGQPGSAIIGPGLTVEHVPAGPPRPLGPGGLAMHVPEFADHLADLWRHHPPEVAHAHFWTSGLAALAAARGLDVPVVQTFHGLADLSRQAGLPGSEPAARARMEALIGRSAAAVLASSSAEAHRLVCMGVPRARIRVVPCGVDVERFCPDGATAPRGGRRRLVCPGPLDRSQGHADVIRALAELPDTELVVASTLTADRDECGRRELVGLAERLQVARRLAVLEPLGEEHLPALFRSADLLVSAAPREPHDQAVVQAMACGTPVVASDVGGHRDAVIDNTTGVLVPSGQPGTLAAQIRLLLRSSVRREAYGIAAADRARSRYPWQRIAGETLACYQQVRVGGLRSANLGSQSEPEARAAEGYATGPMTRDEVLTVSLADIHFAMTRSFLCGPYRSSTHVMI
jgi:glycosyltransferase involved in cell wall biosynthesis